MLNNMKEVYTLYIKNGCPYSMEALDILKNKKQRNVTIKVYDVNNYNGTIDTINNLKKHKFIPKNSQHKTVPIIFHNGKFIGGCSDLKKRLGI